MDLNHNDKVCALARIKELDAKLFLTTEEQQDYHNRIEIIEECDKQFRQKWKAERRAFFKSQLKKRRLTEEYVERKLAQIDVDADAILGKKPVYAWS